MTLYSSRPRFARLCPSFSVAESAVNSYSAALVRRDVFSPTSTHPRAGKDLRPIAHPPPSQLWANPRDPNGYPRDPAGVPLGMLGKPTTAMRNTSGATENTINKAIISAVCFAVSPLARGLIGAVWPALTFPNLSFLPLVHL